MPLILERQYKFLWNLEEILKYNRAYRPTDQKIKNLQKNWSERTDSMMFFGVMESNWQNHFTTFEPERKSNFYDLLSVSNSLRLPKQKQRKPTKNGDEDAPPIVSRVGFKKPIGSDLFLGHEWSQEGGFGELEGGSAVLGLRFGGRREEGRRCGRRGGGRRHRPCGVPVKPHLWPEAEKDGGGWRLNRIGERPNVGVILAASCGRPHLSDSFRTLGSECGCM